MSETYLNPSYDGVWASIQSVDIDRRAGQATFVHRKAGGTLDLTKIFGRAGIQVLGASPANNNGHQVATTVRLNEFGAAAKAIAGARFNQNEEQRNFLQEVALRV